MSCESCYNGCVDVLSDKCVRYTGVTYASVGIDAGDSLYQVEIALIEKVISFLNGSGINISINPTFLCNYIQTFLPAGSTFTLPAVISGIIRAICDINTRVVNINNTLTILNADYTIGCLTGVTASSDTHDIVQATINKLCAVSTDLTALTLNVNTNYVKLADLDALIAAYIASTSGGGSNQQYLKMVPYVAYEYYGPLTNFDGSGIGIPASGFFKVYLCNGLNGTPDKRGRVAVGAVQNVPGGPLDAAVNPANAGNPNYALYSTAGANTVTLITSQIPAHSHNAIAISTASISPNPHSHTVAGVTGNGGSGNAARRGDPATLTTSTVDLSVSVSTGVTISSTGSGAAHPNIQPVIAAYYIMYIP